MTLEKRGVKAMTSEMGTVKEGVIVKHQCIAEFVKKNKTSTLQLLTIVITLFLNLGM